MISLLFIAAEATKFATDSFIDYVSKRAVNALADEASGKVYGLFSGAKHDLLGSLKLPDFKPDNAALAPIIESALADNDLAIIGAAELQALLNIAKAVESNSGVTEAFDQWKEKAMGRDKR